jgi:hypothetical protein
VFKFPCVNIYPWCTFGYQVIFEGVYTLHPAIRKLLDFWIAVVSFLFPNSSEHCFLQSCFITTYLKINILRSRLVEFTHIFLQEFRETRIVLVFLFHRMKSWPLCFHSFSNTLNHILYMLMLVQGTQLFTFTSHIWLSIVLSFYVQWATCTYAVCFFIFLAA